MLRRQFLDQFVNGVTLGMLYILVALGLNIILGLMGVINFSHGAFFMLGAYLMYAFVPLVGFWPAILIAAVLVGLLGMAFESALDPAAVQAHPEYTLLLTFGTALIFAQVVRTDLGRRRGARRAAGLHPAVDHDRAATSCRSTRTSCWCC